MAIQWKKVWASKVGKGVPQTQQKDEDGNLLYEDEAKTKPVMGNEQFQYDKLTDESVSSESDQAFVTDVLEAVQGDLSKAARAFREGLNRINRTETGASDPFTTAAKGIEKMARTNPLFAKFKGKTVEQIAEMLKTANI